MVHSLLYISFPIPQVVSGYTTATAVALMPIVQSAIVRASERVNHYFSVPFAYTTITRTINQLLITYPQAQGTQFDACSRPKKPKPNRLPYHQPPTRPRTHLQRYVHRSCVPSATARSPVHLVSPLPQAPLPPPRLPSISCSAVPRDGRPTSSPTPVTLSLDSQSACHILSAPLGPNFSSDSITIALKRNYVLVIIADCWSSETECQSIFFHLHTRFLPPLVTPLGHLQHPLAACPFQLPPSPRSNGRIYLATELQRLIASARTGVLIP